MARWGRIQRRGRTASLRFGSPFVTFEERKGGLLAAHIVVWSLRFLTLLPLLAYYIVMRFTGATPGGTLFGAVGTALVGPEAGLTWLQTPVAEAAALLIVPLALYWFLGRYTPRRFVVQVERWFGKGTVVNSVAAVAKVVSLAGLLSLVAYYGAYLTNGRPGIAWWLGVMNTPMVMGFTLWVLPLLLYWLVAISIPGRTLSGLGERVSALREKLPVKYDPREEKQAFYLNYQTPGDEPGLGLRLQGLITWIIQTLALSMACVLAAGIGLAIIGGLEALLLSNVLGGHGFLGSIGLSPKIGDQQWRFISLIDVITAAPAAIWNTLASIPGLSSLMGGPAELRLGGLANAPQASEYMPVALFTAAGSLLFGLLPTILLALTVAFAVGVWLRNSMAGFGRENFAWTLANKIRVSKRAGPNSMLRTINISRDAWWNRDIAHCFYYKSDAITKDLAHFIAHPELLKSDEPSYPTGAVAAATARWLVVTLFVFGIFAAAVPIAQKGQILPPQPGQPCRLQSWRALLNPATSSWIVNPVALLWSSFQQANS